MVHLGTESRPLRLEPRKQSRGGDWCRVSRAQASTSIAIPLAMWIVLEPRKKYPTTRGRAGHQPTFSRGLLVPFENGTPVT